MHRTLFVILTFCLFIVAPLWAQTRAISESSSDEQSAADEELSLFDEDVEETDDGWSQLSVSAGYMWLKADGRYAIQLPSGKLVTVLDLDRIGIDDKDTSAWFTINWRSANSRWGAWFGAWRYDAAGFRIWVDELIIDDKVIVPVGAGVATDLRTDWYILEATYSFWQNKTVDVGVGFGLHTVDLDTKLGGRLEVGDENDQIVNSRFDFLAPLPNILAYGHWRISDKWRLTSRLGWFGLSYGDYRGKMTNLHALLRYQMTDRWAIECGYQFMKLDLDIKEERYTSVYGVDITGPLAVLRFNF